MGFVFRTAFWLALAIVLVPPQARLGGTDTADLEELDVAAAVSEMSQTAWAIGQAALNTCDTNPGLCKAGQELIDTTVATATSLANEVETRWHDAPEPPRQVAEFTPQRTKKIQARVE